MFPVSYSNITTNRNRYLTGISQLDIAAQQVAVMQEQLIALEPKLKEASEIVAEQVAKVTADSKLAEEQREIVKLDESAAKEQAAVAQEIKDECDAKLGEALPILESALAAFVIRFPNSTNPGAFPRSSILVLTRS